jgi:hypothetical protein
MDLTYLMTPTNIFGPGEWVFFIAAIAVALGGVYLAFLYTNASPIRVQAVRPIGYAAIAGGILAALLGAVRLTGATLAPFWFTIATVLLFAVAGYAAYIVLSALPKQLAAAQPRPRVPSSRPVTAQRANSAGSTGNPANGVSRPVATTTRREARRDRKRRGK